jgi:hypothetical protein
LVQRAITHRIADVAVTDKASAIQIAPLFDPDQIGNAVRCCVFDIPRLQPCWIFRLKMIRPG